MTDIMKDILENIVGLHNIEREFGSKLEAYPVYTGLIRDVHFSMRILTDTGEPVLFEHSPLMKEAIEDDINRKGVKIQFVFHTHKDYNKAVEQFSRVNPNLLRLSRDPFAKLYLSLFWVPKRTPHYSIIDDEWVYIEEPHKRGQDTAIKIYHNLPLARDLSRAYDEELIKKCVKVE